MPNRSTKTRRVNMRVEPKLDDRVESLAARFMERSGRKCTRTDIYVAGATALLALEERLSTDGHGPATPDQLIDLIQSLQLPLL